MATLTLRNGTTVTVPDDVAQSYTSRGQVHHGEPAPAEQGLDAMTVPQLREYAEMNGIELGIAKLEDDIRAVIDNSG